MVRVMVRVKVRLRVIVMVMVMAEWATEESPKHPNRLFSSIY